MVHRRLPGHRATDWGPVTYFQPILPILLLIGIVGLIRSWRSSVTGRRPWWELISLGGIWLFSIEAGAWVLARPLEARYVERAIPESSADAMVVLAGAVDTPRSGRPYPVAGPDTYRRVRHAAWLFHHWQRMPIL